MGDNADMILDGFLDEQTGEYLDKVYNYPKTYKQSFHKYTPEEQKIKSIRKELAILIKQKQQNCITEKEKNKAINDARMEINIKYGKDWRNKNA